MMLAAFNSGHNSLASTAMRAIVAHTMPDEQHVLEPTSNTAHHHNFHSLHPVPSSALSGAFYGPFQGFQDVNVNTVPYPYDDALQQFILSPNSSLTHNYLSESLSNINNSHHQAASASRNSEYSPLQPSVQSLTSESCSPLINSGPGHAHTMLPPMIQPNPGDPSMQFNADTQTFNQHVSSNNSSTTGTDPHAAAFLCQELGPEKWNIFSARLFERRLNPSKSKPRTRGRSESESDSKSAACTIDFLMKVEAVKEILRTYVPHPYNPLKSLTHQYGGSSSGHVTLTRSTVLALSGWSNTQFSYWARRVEGISVLARHDRRLRSVADALERRLRGETLPQSDQLYEDDALNITGKGLDAVIEEVKKKTGLSQFLRGKHSSLDPFGSVSGEVENGAAISAPATVYNATFQAVAYTHSPPEPSVPPSGEKYGWKGLGKRKEEGRRKRRKDIRPGISLRLKAMSASVENGTANKRSSSSKATEMNVSSDLDTDSPPHLSFTISDSRVKSPSAIQPTCSVVTRFSKRKKSISASTPTPSPTESRFLTVPQHSPSTRPRRSVAMNKN